MAELSSRLSAGIRAWIAAGLLLALVSAHVHAELPPTAARLARASSKGPSDLELAVAYLPAVAGFKKVGFVLSFLPHHFTTWTVHEQCRCRAVVEWPATPVASRGAVRAAVEEWVEHTPAQRIVVIDTFEKFERSDMGWTRTQTLGMLDAMASQQRFEKIETIALPSYPAEISIWSPRKTAAEK